MSRLMLAFLLIALLAITPAFASSSDVQTYVQQAAPDDDTVQDRFNSPLQAGQMTLEDVLAAHPAPKKLIPAPIVNVQTNQLPTVAAPQAATATAPSAPSSTNVMLLQGMQSALQQSPNDDQGLRPPQIRATIDSTTAPQQPASVYPAFSISSIPVSPSVRTPPSQPVEQNEINAAAPSVTYQPDQAPKNLAASKTTTSNSTMPSYSVTSSGVMSPSDIIQQQPTPSLTSSQSAPVDITQHAAQNNVVSSASPVAPTPEATIISSSNDCVPHVVPWTKTCLEAGYDASYVGSVRGETRTLCPDNRLQDVWLANSCTSQPTTAPAIPVVQPTASPSASSASTVISPAQSPTEVIQQQTPPTSKPYPVQLQQSTSPPVAAASASSLAPSTQVAAPTYPGCTPQTSSWTKTCAEAGYPQHYVGQIRGETRSVCPGNTLQDVWISNSCASPSAEDNSGPLTAPDTVETIKSSPTNSQCGSAILLARRDQPTDNLCNSGVVSTVTGNGPWTWTCRSPNGGANSTCETPVIIDGVCGSANNQETAQKPVNNLCYKGTASRVNADSSWRWTCQGINGGESQNCSAGKSSATTDLAPVPAPQPTASSTYTALKPSRSTTNKICGSASELMAIQAPDKNLCASGSASDVEGSGPWTWSCTDDSGHKDNCSTLSPLGTLSDAVSNDNSKRAHNETSSLSEAPAPMAHPTVPVTSSAPKAPPAIKPVSDTALPECGLAAGATTPAAPTEDFCSEGAASKLTSAGNSWTWTCSTRLGGQVTCSSYKKVDALCGSADGSALKSSPTKGLCALGTATDVKGSGPWSWNCIDESNKADVRCSAKKAVTHAEAAPTPTPSPALVSTESLSTAPNVTDKSASLADVKPFGTPPQPTKTPAVPNPTSIPTPQNIPELPKDAKPLQPPPVVAPTTLSTTETAASIVQAATPAAAIALPSNLSVITFAHGSENLDSDGQPIVDKLASFMQDNRTVRITLTAYADGTGETVREARRLSLVRALAIRDSLTSQGIVSSRINVRALGQAPSGNTDRVDVTAE